MSENGDLQRYQYYTFWPNEKNVSKTFKTLVDEFYFAITHHFSGKALELFSDGNNWCSMCNARFLHPTIQEDKAVGELAMKHSVENFSPFAEKFRQHEELTVRIKNIIAAYPSKKDILKELIQNADDAEATEIHFVLDKRNHSTERTFGERWHPLQGPALCVYNNQVFSEADLRGIQQLGEGGKHNIQGKTGKYGLGFNSVYHLTDCPSILTGDKWLCISDPNLKYVEGGSQESPGRKYTLKKELKNTFMDVYNTFLPNEFSLEKGTMFRLPIRTCAMAKTSKISNNVVNDRDIDELSSALQLLSIEKSISEKCLAERVYFQNHVQQSLLSDGPTTPHEAIYNVKILSSDKRQSQWIIAEQFGSFKGNTDMKGETGRVPQASLAACVSSHSKQDDFSGQVLCSLPLPGKTGLPVHVNGHFQVDSSRRALWKEDGKSLKTDWNESLKRNIIAPLYAGLLNYICNLMKGKSNSIHLNNSVLDSSYLSFFPTITEDIGLDWHEMIHEVYRSVNEKELCVMSSVIDVESKEDMSSILLKLGLMKINIKFFRHVDQLLYQHLLPELLKTSDGSAVLDQIHQLEHSEFRPLSNDELIKLLHFLHSGMCSSKNRQGYQRKLKSLPLFETIQGTRQQIDGQQNVFILKTEFKESFPDLYMADDNN
uniref:Sacsin/Nov domain-containing protein n=1 Tax=Hucho hucho TaxID=62062 RepID=A0A4W5NX70_9TELE